MSPSQAQDPEKMAVWDVETSHPDIIEKLDSELRLVIDPEIGLNILELGLVRNVMMKEDGKSAHIVMIMTTPFCPYAPAMLEMTRTKVTEVLEVPSTIEMGMELWDLTYMEEGTGADWGLF